MFRQRRPRGGLDVAGSGEVVDQQLSSAGRSGRLSLLREVALVGCLCLVSFLLGVYSRPPQLVSTSEGTTIAHQDASALLPVPTTTTKIADESVLKESSQRLLRDLVISANLPPSVGQTADMPTTRSKDEDIKKTTPATSSFRGGTCTPEMAERQGNFLLAARVRGCPSDDDAWLTVAQLLLPKARIFFDIGSNKGYTAARFFELWSPELGVNAQSLHSALLSVSTDHDLTECGACSDCKESGSPFISIFPRICGRKTDQSVTGPMDWIRTVRSSISKLCNDWVGSFKPIRVFSFDGNPSMIEGVSKARDHLASQEGRLASMQDVPEERLPRQPRARFLRDHWSLELAAFSDHYEPGKMADFTLGEGERGFLVVGEGVKKAQNTKGRVKVPLLTVDHIMEREGLEHIDVLKMDTEGHDPSVLRGALKAITSHRVTLIIFEYNLVWETSEKLERVIAEIFDKNDYACYLEGTTSLLKLTQGCWWSTFEFRDWSNVWCMSLKTPSGSALSQAFDGYSIAFL